MSELDRTIREAVGTLIDAAPPPPRLDEEASERLPRPLATTPRTSRGWAIAAAAMAVSLAVVGGLTVLVAWMLPPTRPAPTASTADLPHVLLPLEDAVAAAAPFDTTVAGFTEAYESGDREAVADALAGVLVREDATFPSVLGKAQVMELLFPEAPLEPECSYLHHYSGSGLGLYIAACPERFGYEYPDDEPLVEVSRWHLDPDGRIPEFKFWAARVSARSE